MILEWLALPFVSCFTRPAYQIAENESYMKVQEIKMGVYKIVCLSVKFHGHAFGTSSLLINQPNSRLAFAHRFSPIIALLSHPPT